MKHRDIRKKKFKKVISGYSAEEVDAFLEKLANDFQQLEEEIKEIRERQDQTAESLRKEAEKVLREAEGRSQAMIKDAEKEAAAILRKLHSEKADLEATLTALQNQRDRLRHSLQQVIASQQDLIEILDYRGAHKSTNHKKEK